MGSMGEVFSFLASQFAAIRFLDIVDILLVAVLLYYVIHFFRERRAGKLAVGVLFLVLGLVLSDLLEMRAVKFILEAVLSVGVLALIIIFQPELRAMLEKMGRGSLSGLGRLVKSKTDEEASRAVGEIALAVSELAATKTGALIVFERETKLGDEIRTGTVLNADITAPLIRNIFYDKAPLHDGAMILRDGRVYACGCFLPLSANPEVDRRLGTRHRAALGVSEISDALIIVVSEETGTISLCRDGRIRRGFDRYTLENELIRLADEAKNGRENAKIKRLFSSKKKSETTDGEEDAE